MALDLATVDHLLSSTRAVRKRLDLQRPVERSVVEECLELAVQAPTASNMQGWRWMVLDDPGQRRALADIYRRGFEPYFTATMEAAAAGPVDPQAQRVAESARYLADHLHEVPVLVVPCIVGWGLPLSENQAGASFYGSIFPAVWSFQLALRARGLGSALTTLHLAHEADARELLGIPDHVVQVGLLPVAYFTGDDFKPAARPPVSEITHWNHWG